MAFNIGTLLGSNLGQMFKDIVGTFKASPDKVLEMQEMIQNNAAAVQQKQLELDGKLQDAVAKEIEESAEVIKTEAQSQSWLPRNVRPLLLLLWGSLITLNYVMGVVSQFVRVAYTPLTLPDWLYKLTAIGYTGYVGFRTWEKLKDSDN